MAKVCNSCINCGGKQGGCRICQYEGYNICSVCGDGQKIWKGSNSVDAFTEYLYFNLARKAEKVGAQIIVFAHNSKGYDGHFILSNLFTRHFAEQPTIIMQGQKILRLQVNNISFIDSLSFFMMPLAELPKVFGFEDEMKGFFPHEFNTEENYEYKGVLPDAKYYGHRFMKPKKAKEFFDWYENEKNSGKEFHLKYELEFYCENDVKILTIAIQKFREIFKEISGLDPVTRNFTLASVGLEQFR